MVDESIRRDRDAGPHGQLLDDGEILSCTFATMDMLRRALAAELGADDGADYGMAKRELRAAPDSDRPRAGE